jgi:hypothetical protein
LTPQDIFSIFALIINELIREIMKKQQILTGTSLFVLIFFFLMATQQSAGQKAVVSSPALPDNLNKIFSNSCKPCHYNKGSKMALIYVNFDDWTNLTPDKQASKADKIYKNTSNGFMPKKSEVAKRPDIVLSKEQKDMIKTWSESLKVAK